MHLFGLGARMRVRERLELRWRLLWEKKLLWGRLQRRRALQPDVRRDHVARLGQWRQARREFEKLR